MRHYHIIGVAVVAKKDIKEGEELFFESESDIFPALKEEEPYDPGSDIESFYEDLKAIDDENRKIPEEFRLDTKKPLTVHNVLKKSGKQ